MSCLTWVFAIPATFKVEVLSFWLLYMQIFKGEGYMGLSLHPFTAESLTIMVDGQNGGAALMLALKGGHWSTLPVKERAYTLVEAVAFMLIRCGKN